MRAVVWGLVGAVLLSGAAMAGDSCPETKAVLVSEPSAFLVPGETARTDLVGREWRVENPRGRSRGWSHSVVLTNGHERIVVGQEINPGTTPAVGFTSWPYGAAAAPAGRPSSPKKVSAVGEYAYKVFGGPLGGMRLKVSRCMG